MNAVPHRIEFRAPGAERPWDVWLIHPIDFHWWMMTPQYLVGIEYPYDVTRDGVLFCRARNSTLWKAWNPDETGPPADIDDEEWH